jgi:hypothetical protein
MDLAGKQVLVLGLGVSGLSMARWLARRGARVRVADTRQAPPCAAQLARELPDVPVALGAFRAEDFAGADLSPSVQASRWAAGRCAGCAARRPVVGDVGCSRRHCRGDTQGAGYHRLQRQEHGDRDGGRHVPRGRVAHDRGRQHRLAGAGRARAGRAGTLRRRAPSRPCMRPKNARFSRAVSVG